MFAKSGPLPAIVGHRGAPRIAPENTLAAFAAAFAAGAGWVELDARRTADGKVVVIHDPVTPDGVPVVERELAELEARGLVGLERLLVELPPGLGVDIELKNLPGEPDYDEDQRLGGMVADALRPGLGARPAVVSSFNPMTLGAVRAALPDVPLGLLTIPVLELASGIELAQEFGMDAVFPHVTAPDLSAETIRAAHERGLAVMAWTVDEPDDARRLAEAGIDALCTNDPAGLRAAIHSS